MKYIIRWFRTVIEKVILFVATVVFVIKLFRYTNLYESHKIDVSEYKLYGSNAAYDYCCICERYGLIDIDTATSAYNGFIKNMNGNS